MMMRFTTKRFIFKCFFFLLSWIFLTFVIYTFWKDDYEEVKVKHTPSKSNQASLSSDERRTKKIQEYCNSPENIKLGHEGKIRDLYDLSGIIIVTRHGDRGPLIKVKNMSSIDCDYGKNFPLFDKYEKDLKRISHTSEYLNFVGSFSKFPNFPSSNKCLVGHLTPLGVEQHLRLGDLLRKLYYNKLFPIDNTMMKSHDILVVSTRFRRTFQSALAFIYSFMLDSDFLRAKLYDSESYNFCGQYCQCEKAAVYYKKFKMEKKHYLNLHPSIVNLVNDLNHLVRNGNDGNSFDTTTPNVVRDALMAYVCHGAEHPCSGSRNCASSPNNLMRLISYEEWEAKQYGSGNKIKDAKLKSFGFLQSILDTVTSIIEYGKPKVVLYSGHDKTLSELLLALGIRHFHAPYYASRIIFEIYYNTSLNGSRDRTKNGFLFRLIYNGKDITKQLTFCKLTIVKIDLETDAAKPRNIVLCPVESFENFVSSSTYFREFSANTFMEACKV